MQVTSLEALASGTKGDAWEAATLPASEWSSWRDETVRDAPGIKKQGRSQGSYTRSRQEKVEREKLWVGGPGCSGL